MLRPKAGRIVFDDVDTTKLDSSATYELGIGQVAEGRQIFPLLTVEENLVLGGALKRVAARRKENFERVYAMFPKLNERRDQKAGTLSGGARKPAQEIDRIARSDDICELKLQRPLADKLLKVVATGEKKDAERARDFSKPLWYKVVLFNSFPPV
jgi:ABC-type lipopolysaccharide export system ATPase subunit